MTTKDKLIKRLNTIEKATIENSIALTLLHNECETNGYSGKMEEILKLQKHIEYLLNEIKILQLICEINDN